MKLDTTVVKTVFSQLSGEAANPEGTDREVLCAALCDQCARQVEGLLRQDLAEEDLAPWESALEELAAAQAFYQLLLTEEAVTPPSLSAGNLKITQGGGSEKAARLVAEKRRAASPALREEGFYFGRVEKEDAHDAAQ